MIFTNIGHVANFNSIIVIIKSLLVTYVDMGKGCSCNIEYKINGRDGVLTVIAKSIQCYEEF